MEIALTLAIVVATVILFATERFSIDFVAFLVLVTLTTTGLVTPIQGISGFSNPATITVAAMFVLSAGLERTGALEWFGQTLIRIGRSPTLLMFLVISSAGLSSAFINNTAVVAVFLPIVMSVAIKRKVPPSLLLIPMSFASQAGGVCTLIGTSTNLLVSSISEEAGLEPFNMFELGKLGVILLLLTAAYFLLFGKALLPRRRSQELTETYQLGGYITELRINEKSPLVGNSLKDMKLSSKHEVKILKVLRNNRALSKHYGKTLEHGDILLVEGKIKDLLNLKDFEGLEIEPEFKLKDESLKEEDTMLIEALIPPRSRLLGRTLEELDFYSRFNLIVLAVQRRGHTLYEKLISIKLTVGDTLLIQGHKDEVEKLKKNKNFIVLEKETPTTPLKKKAPRALAIVFLVVALAALNILPIVASSLLGCLLMVLTKCLPADEVYDAIDWRIIFLLGGIIPLGIALENSGAALWIVTGSLKMIGGFGPFVTLAVLYAFTTLLTEAMSNNAAAILLAPIGITIAGQMGVHPKPFLITIAFAASTSFLTPVGYQTNTMVYSAGGYYYTDFAKIGLPLNLLFWGVSSCLIPWFWPF